MPLLNKSGVESVLVVDEAQILSDVENALAVGCIIPREIGVDVAGSEYRVAYAGTPLNLNLLDVVKIADVPGKETSEPSPIKTKGYSLYGEAVKRIWSGNAYYAFGVGESEEDKRKFAVWFKTYLEPFMSGVGRIEAHVEKFETVDSRLKVTFTEDTFPSAERSFFIDDMGVTTTFPASSPEFIKSRFLFGTYVQYPYIKTYFKYGYATFDTSKFYGFILEFVSSVAETYHLDDSITGEWKISAGEKIDGTNNLYTIVEHKGGSVSFKAPYFSDFLYYTAKEKSAKETFVTGDYITFNVLDGNIPRKTQMNAVLLHNVDLTDGDTSGVALVFGIVNVNRVDSITREKLKEAISSYNNAKIAFLTQ